MSDLKGRVIQRLMRASLALSVLIATAPAGFT